MGKGESGEKSVPDNIIDKVWETDKLDEVPEEEAFVETEKPKRIQKALKKLFEFLSQHVQAGGKPQGPFGRLGKVYDFGYFDEHLGLNDEDEIRIVMNPIPGFEISGTESGEVGYRLVNPKESLNYLSNLIGLVGQVGKAASPELKTDPTAIGNLEKKNIGSVEGLNYQGLHRLLSQKLKERGFSTTELEHHLRGYPNIKGGHSVSKIVESLKIKRVIVVSGSDPRGHTLYKVNPDYTANNP